MGDMQIVVASNNGVEPQYVEMGVPLYSYGCEKKVKKALAHLKGIYSVNIDFYKQKVTVWGICNKYDVLETIRNKRKGARFWNAEDNIEQVKNDSPSSSSSPLFQPKRSNYSSHLTLNRAQSFSWKTLKKVFVRSSSFS